MCIRDRYLMGNVEYMSILTTAEKLATIILTAVAVPLLLRRTGKRNMMLIGSCVVAAGHAPVSYTHLDVYKRQGKSCRKEDQRMQGMQRLLGQQGKLCCRR